LKIRTIAFLVMLGSVMAPAFGVNYGNPDALKQLGCTDKEVQEIIAIDAKYSAEIDAGKTESKASRAQLKELELSTDMDTVKAEKLLRKFHDSEFRQDLAKFTRNAKIKKILGQERWDKAQKILKNKKDKAE
jgi:Spy/CpxP family protein refolding chaperone